MTTLNKPPSCQPLRFTFRALTSCSSSPLASRTWSVNCLQISPSSYSFLYPYEFCICIGFLVPAFPVSSVRLRNAICGHRKNERVGEDRKMRKREKEGPRGKSYSTRLIQRNMSTILYSFQSKSGSHPSVPLLLRKSMKDTSQIQKSIPTIRQLNATDSGKCQLLTGRQRCYYVCFVFSTVQVQALFLIKISTTYKLI